MELRLFLFLIGNDPDWSFSRWMFFLENLNFDSEVKEITILMNDKRHWRLFIQNIIVFFIFFSDSAGLNVVFSPCCCVTEQAKGSDTPLLYLLSRSIAHLAEDAVNTGLRRTVSV